MNNHTWLGPWIKRFLVEYLTTVKNFSFNTQRSYRDTLCLFLPFVADHVKKDIDQLLVEDVSRECTQLFLLDLEKRRHSSISTRNQRLAAIHSLAQFIGLHGPEYLEWSGQIRSIPFKRAPHVMIAYLEKKEMDALLGASEGYSPQKQRDHAILLFLYNTGARADEAAKLTIGDLHLGHTPGRDYSSVTIRGKGNKLRHCPLWTQTVKEINLLIEGRDAKEHVFLNRFKQPMTRFGVYALVERYALKALNNIPSLKAKRVSPHTIRHTTATHLLRAGVDINTIRAWLGHVSINTTNIYAETDLEMKAKALALCEIESKPVKRWHEDKNLIEFLRTIR